MEYMLAGSRKKLEGSGSSMYNINVRLMKDTDLIEWIRKADDEDEFSPNADYIIDKIKNMKNIWFDNKYFMFAAKPAKSDKQQTI